MGVAGGVDRGVEAAFGDPKMAGVDGVVDGGAVNEDEDATRPFSGLLKFRGPLLAVVVGRDLFRAFLGAEPPAEAADDEPLGRPRLTPVVTDAFAFEADCIATPTRRSRVSNGLVEAPPPVAPRPEPFFFLDDDVDDEDFVDDVDDTDDV